MRKIQTLLNNILGMSPLQNKFSQEQILQFLEAEHRELCEKYHLVVQTSDINLVAGTTEYLLPANFQAVNAATYCTNATDRVALQGINYGSEFNHDPLMEFMENGSPLSFYVRNGKIGLQPPPDTTTSAGYPKIVVDCSMYSALVPSGICTPDDEIPAEIPNPDVYEFGAAVRALRRAALNCDDLDQAKAKLEFAEYAYKAALSELEVHFDRKNKQYKAVPLHRESFFPGAN
jgi:hypothetical protein